MERNVPVAQATPFGAGDASTTEVAATLAASSILPVSEDKLSDRNLDKLVREGYSSGE